MFRYLHIKRDNLSQNETVTWEPTHFFQSNSSHDFCVWLVIAFLEFSHRQVECWSNDNPVKPDLEGKGQRQYEKVRNTFTPKSGARFILPNYTQSGLTCLTKCGRYGNAKLLGKTVNPFRAEKRTAQLSVHP